MATLNFKFLSNDKGLKDGIRSSSGALGKFEGTAKKISSNIGKALGGIGIALGATAIVGQLKDAAKAAAEEATQQRLLALQLKTTTNATDEQIQSAEKFIDKLSRSTGELDDNLRPALSNAVRATGSLTKGQELLEIALDGARASGKPLDTVLQALLKANNGNTTALYKLAPQLKKTKGGIDDYAKSVKGAAEESANPFDKMQVAMENVQERLGTALLPLLEKFADWVIDVAAPAIEQFIDDLGDPSTKPGMFWKAISDTVKGIWDLITDIMESDFGKYMGLAFEATADALAWVIAKLQDFWRILTGKGTIQSKVTQTGVTKNSSRDVVAATLRALGQPFDKATVDRALADKVGGSDGNKYTPWPMADGGIVLPRPGGTIARIGEAGRPEAVIPLDRFGSMGNNSYTININRAQLSGIDVITAIRRYETKSGRRYLLGNA